MTKISTELEQKLYHELNRANWWLENLAEVLGDARLMDSCPNGWGGRGAIREALQNAERQHPDITELPQGTWVTDGIFRGFIKGHGMLGKIPCYRVDIGAGVDSLMPRNQARRI